MKKLLSTIALSLLMFGSSIAYAAHDVKLIVPNAPGGATARLAEIWKSYLNSELNSQDITVTLEYRPSSAGISGTQRLVTQDNSDMALLISSNQVVTNAVLRPGNYTLKKDIIPVGYAGTSPMILVTRNESNVKSVDDLTANNMFDMFKSNKLLAHSGKGSGNWLAATSLSKTMNMKVDMVGYKGNAPALKDLLGGHVDVMVDFLSTSSKYLESGKSRALLSLTQERLPEFPNVVSYGEINQGKDFPTPIWWGLYSNNTDNHELKQKIVAAIKSAYNDTEFLEFAKQKGYVIKDVNMNSYVDEQYEFIKSLNLEL